MPNCLLIVRASFAETYPSESEDPAVVDAVWIREFIDMNPGAIAPEVLGYRPGFTVASVPGTTEYIVMGRIDFTDATTKTDIKNYIMGSAPNWLAPGLATPVTVVAV